MCVSFCSSGSRAVDFCWPPKALTSNAGQATAKIGSANGQRSVRPGWVSWWWTSCTGVHCRASRPVEDACSSAPQPHDPTLSTLVRCGGLRRPEIMVSERTCWDKQSCLLMMWSVAVPVGGVTCGPWPPIQKLDPRQWPPNLQYQNYVHYSILFNVPNRSST